MTPDDTRTIQDHPGPLDKSAGQPVTTGYTFGSHQVWHGFPVDSVDADVTAFEIFDDQFIPFSSHFNSITQAPGRAASVSLVYDWST